ncbi:helix-turn-helix domain-containing protein [Streptomyces sp. NPDC090112]|uniref:helix-turn-helix domain-containing protein n=1 Tax=Streptomyces sp. NPDC090112 TaxID=3365949 RepID=UPI003816A6A2
MGESLLSCRLDHRPRFLVGLFLRCRGRSWRRLGGSGRPSCLGRAARTPKIAGMVGVHTESVRRWRRAWENGGAQAMRQWAGIRSPAEVG